MPPEYDSRSSAPTIGQIFYGWKIVAALFVMLAFSSGLGFYNHAIILQALTRESGYSIELASSAVSLFFLVSGVTGLIIAPILEKHDVRIVIVVGAILAAASLWLVAKVTTPVELLLVYALFGVGFSASGLLPATVLVARWFQTNRAKALSIASTGLSFGGITLTPLSAYLVTHYTLAVSSTWLAVLYFVGIIPIACLVLRSSPAELGLQPDGKPADPSRFTTSILLADAIRQQFFWGLSIAYIFAMLAQVGAIAHQFGVLSERLTLDQASYGIAILPACSVVGRLVGGMVLDRISTQKYTLFMMLGQGLSLLMIAYADSVYLLYLSLALFGVSVGNLLMLQPLLIAEVYGLTHYSQIYSWSNLIAMLGIASGPVLMGVLFGWSGGYELPYLVAGVFGMCATGVFFLVKAPGVEHPIK